MLARRQLPLFALEDHGGTGPASWWQRREMVVALVHGDCLHCSEVRHRLAELDANLRSRDAGTLAVVIDDRSGAGAALAARVARSVGIEPATASVVVADRYGDVFAVLPIHGPEAATVIEEVESWLDYIQQQCPE